MTVPSKLDVIYSKEVPIIHKTSTTSSEFFFYNKTRHVILLISTLCLTCIFANSLTFNFTVICMNDIVLEENSTELHWLHSPSHVNGLFSAIAVGSLVGTLPLMHFIQYFGVRQTMTFYGVASGFATILFPLAVNAGYPFVFLVRAIQGTAIGIAYSSTGAITSHWSVLRESGTYIALISSHVQISSVLTMSSAGIICETTFGWRVIYYFFGFLTLLFYFIFYLFFRDHPKLHRHVSRKELSRITADKPEFTERQPVPYKAIITSKVIISVWLSCIGGSAGFLIFLYYGPTYVNKVLGFDVRSTGFVTALPYTLAALVKFVSGPLSDNATCLSEKVRLLLFAVLSQGVMALSFIMMAFTSSPVIAQIAYTVSIIFSGLNIVGTIKCAQLVAQQYVHFVMAVISMAMCILTLVMPGVVVLVCPDNTKKQWSTLFLGIAVFVICMNLPFTFLADAEPAAWTQPGFGKQGDFEGNFKKDKHIKEEKKISIQVLTILDREDIRL